MIRFRKRARAREDQAPPRSGVNSVLAAADALVASRHYDEALRTLTEANRAQRDRRIEQRLVELRSEAYHATTWPTERPAWPDVEDHFPGELVPEIDAKDLDVERLRSAIQHHGSLIVRGVVSPERVDRLVEDIDRGLAAFDAIADNEDQPELTGWYREFERDQVSDRVRKRARGSIMTVESPPAMFDLMETFDATGLSAVVRDYFGEPPTLLARKGTLRRIEHGGNTGGWHQDGAFMGTDIRSLNIWLALTHCGDDAPGLDIVGRRLHEIVKTGDGAFAAWATSPDAAEAVAAGTIVRPIFERGDALLFDQLNLHRTAIDPGMVNDRYAIETWLFAPSTYGSMTTEVDDGYTPQDQIPVVF